MLMDSRRKNVTNKQENVFANQLSMEKNVNSVPMDFISSTAYAKTVNVTP